jgi:hypothetical protein
MSEPPAKRLKPDFTLEQIKEKEQKIKSDLNYLYDTLGRTFDLTGSASLILYAIIYILDTKISTDKSELVELVNNYQIGDYDIVLLDNITDTKKCEYIKNLFMGGFRTNIKNIDNNNIKSVINKTINVSKGIKMINESRNPVIEIDLIFSGGYDTEGDEDKFKFKIDENRWITLNKPALKKYNSVSNSNSENNLDNNELKEIKKAKHTNKHKIYSKIKGYINTLKSKYTPIPYTPRAYESPPGSPHTPGASRAYESPRTPGASSDNSSGNNVCSNLYGGSRTNTKKTKKTVKKSKKSKKKLNK